VGCYDQSLRKIGREGRVLSARAGHTTKTMREGAVNGGPDALTLDLMDVPVFT